ncbi:MAG: pseudouridine synthase [Prochloraceae cyanobacterium]|nr:pseudouridine synthase [Prochloraceae cyanobacterium]
MEQRVQKILSQWGIASRRKAEEMILEGRVRLNGSIVELGQKADPDRDLLVVDGNPIESSDRPQSIYLLLNKPEGVVSTCFDPQNRPTVLDLLPPEFREGQGIHPVGRLDADSTGALLLTNDGELTVNLTHPRYHLSKIYQVWIKGIPSQQVLQMWRSGVIILDKKTLPAQVKIVKKKKYRTLLEIVMTEGKNRQIRRIAKHFGFEVLKLHRTAIGKIKLQPFNHGPNLPSGQYRFLNDSEIAYLKNRVSKK